MTSIQLDNWLHESLLFMTSIQWQLFENHSLDNCLHESLLFMTVDSTRQLFARIILIYDSRLHSTIRGTPGPIFRDSGETGGAAACGIHNLLLLTGDDPRAGNEPQAKPVFGLDARSLTELAQRIRDRGELPKAQGLKPNGTPGLSDGAPSPR